MTVYTIYNDISNYIKVSVSGDIYWIDLKSSSWFSFAKKFFDPCKYHARHKPIIPQTALVYNHFQLIRGTKAAPTLAKQLLRDNIKMVFFLTETVQNNNYYMEYALTQIITGEYYRQMVPMENHCLQSPEYNIFFSLLPWCNVS